MASIDLKEIPTKLTELVEDINKDEFIYSLLDIYGTSRSSLTKLKNGAYNVAKNGIDVDFKRKVFFRPVQLGCDLVAELNNIVKTIHNKERFVIVTDYNSFVAKDMQTKKTIKIIISELPHSYRFFAPWAGIEEAETITENPADVKASMQMASLYTEIKKDNKLEREEQTHAMNVFLSRILFCFFAEDTGIFDPNEFSDLIENYSKKDGSDLKELLTALFIVLNTKEEDRVDVPMYLENFPYVNGGLFKMETVVPTFSAQSRKELIDSANRDWEHINPDIFGSMFQSVVTEKQRSNLGQHYTSVTNIMKVLNPLFLDKLNEEFYRLQEQLDQLNNSHLNITKLNNERIKIQNKMIAFQTRLSKIKIFDPACGSGNFLITAYKELCKLEAKIIKATGKFAYSEIELKNFYGIEIDDFAAGIAKLSLWLAQHQMNLMFFDEFNQMNPTLPLSEAGHIVKGNACRMNWEDVCPYHEGDELFICGNPPFGGQGHILDEQREDKNIVFHNAKNIGYLDYVACWFIKVSDYINSHSSVTSAFVSTNSINQGTQVPLIWPLIFKKNVQISFAYQSFLWRNNAQAQAGVTVVIIGLSTKNDIKPTLYKGSDKHTVNHINGYLIDGNDLAIRNRLIPFNSSLPRIIYGSKSTDNGNLILSTEEKDKLLINYPEAKLFIKKFIGSAEFIRNQIRWCLWIEDNNLEFAMSIPEIHTRLENVKKFRLKSKDPTTRKQAFFANRYSQCHYKNTKAIIIPRVSSERRDYIPMGFVDKNTVIADSAFSISDNSEDILHFTFALLTSRMHMVWVRNFAGKLKTDYRYSGVLCYNTFPFPQCSKTQKKQLRENTQKILDTREYYFDKTNGWLYNPDTMPDDLKKAHEENDKYVESLYKPTPFTSDTERLEFLLKEYEKLVKQEEKK